MELHRRTIQDYGRTMSVGLVAGVALAVVFVVAAFAKARFPRGTVEAASALLGRPLPLATAPLLVCAELFVAALLSVPTTRRSGGVASLLLLAAFSVSIGRSLRAGRRPSCSCFGAASRKPISSADLVRNGALGVLALLAIAA